MCRDREITWMLLLATLASSAGCFGVRFHDPVYEPSLSMPWHTMCEPTSKKGCQSEESSAVESMVQPTEKTPRPVLPAWSTPPHSKFHPVPARPVFAPASVTVEAPLVAARELRSTPAPSELDHGDSPLELNGPARLSDASMNEATPIR